MKRKGLRRTLILAGLALALLLFPVLSACGGGDTTETTAAGPSTEVFNLKLAAGSPDMPGKSTDDFKQWAADVAAASGGRLNIEIFFGGALGESKDALTMLDTGVCDMIMEGYGFFSETFPVSDVITLPWLVKSTAACGTLMNSLLADGLLPEYDNIHLLAFKPQDPIMIFFRDKKVETLEDMQGLKIRTNTPGWSTFVESLGGVPTSVATPDLYTSLETGVIDGIVTSLGFFYPMSMYEVAKYAIVEPLGMSMTFIAMSNASWERLPLDLQLILTEVTQNYYWKNIYDQSDEYLNGLLGPVQEKGVELIYLSEEEKAKWMAATQPMIEQWIAKVDGLGYAGSEAVRRAQVLAEVLK
jgi:TRAP-type C4-dicarboxylate transport system substrate-binding protein